MPLCLQTLLFSLLCFVSAAAISAEAETLSPPSVLAQTCVACHGPGGNSDGSAIPSIAGLPRDYMLEVMRDYRFGGRFGTLMGRLIQGLKEEELEQLASYFSAQPFRVHRQRVDWDLAGKGRQLHRIYCRRCHGDYERAPKAGVPGLNGRSMAYLRWTLQDFLIGINQVQEEMAEPLTLLVRRHGEAGLEALVNYYGSAQPEP